MEKTTKENKMGTMPMGPLLASVSVPIVISMLVQALYNVVDSIFVSKIPGMGEQALAAVGLVFPIQNLMIAVSVGTAVGFSSLLSRRLGEKDFEGANRAATNGIFLTILSSLAFAIGGLLLTDLFFAGYTTDSAESIEIAKMGMDYMRIVTIASLGLFMSVTCERLLQSTGRSMYSMVSQMVGAITNIILDPIMIFGLLGFPKLGVAGAAWATVIGQFFGMFVGLYFNLARNKEIKLKFRGFKPHLTTIKNIYQVGLPTIIMQSVGSVMVSGMNKILISFGTTPISFFGVYFKLQSFVFMPVFGFNNGMVPIVAYNYGARNPKRIGQAVRLSAIICFAIMALGTLVFWLIPERLLLLFEAQQGMLEIGVPALRFISISFPLASVSIIFTGMFQALGKGMYSLAMSVVRQLVLLLPLAWLLAHFFDLNAVWYAFPAAEMVAMIIAIYFFQRVWRKMIKPLETSVEQQAEAGNSG